MVSMIHIIYIYGWWLTYPSEKYESQLGSPFPIYRKIKNVPNHQPDMYIIKWVYIYIYICGDLYGELYGELYNDHGFIWYVMVSM